MPCQCDKKIRLFWVDLRLDAIVIKLNTSHPLILFVLRSDLKFPLR